MIKPVKLYDTKSGLLVYRNENSRYEWWVDLFEVDKEGEQTTLTDVIAFDAETGTIETETDIYLPEETK
jgi:hypothetical protein